MDNLLLYLLKVSAGIVIFYLCYILFFSRDTFYVRNRIFLLGIMFFSLIFPLLKVFIVTGGDYTLRTASVMSEIISSGTNISTTVSEKITSFDFVNLLIRIYFLVTGLFLLSIVISITRTLTIIRQGKLIDTGFPKIVLSEFGHTPFSFFPYVVIPGETYEAGEYSEILAHETAHITQGHTFDILLTELLISFLWFNPVVWLLKRSVILNHEYLADNISIKRSHGIKEYQYKLLNLQSGLMNVPLAHNFSSLIKNRIVMINKRPTRNYAVLKSIIILPVAAILFLMFSFKPESSQANTGNQKPLFSQTSESEILKFMAINTGYPQEARNSSDTGKVFVVVKMKKGGIVKECKAFTEAKTINVPLLNEIVIVGHKSAGSQSNSKIEKGTGNEHPELKTECLRVANTLGEVKIPEWKDKDMEFALEVKFILK
jgi:beta-lactamase regulating signal transducer with metallopeptidase domain